MNPKLEFANRIIIWQKEHGYSNMEIAKLINVDVANVVRWKSGRYLPTMSNYRKLGNAGVNILNIEGLPSMEFSSEVLKKFCKDNKISLLDICKMMDVNYSTGYGFSKNNDSRNIESIAQLEAFTKEYACKPVKEEKQEEPIEVADKEPIESVLSVIEESTCTDEGQEEIMINPVPSRRPYSQNVTLRELLKFAGKFNIWDAELKTDGGFDVIGFRFTIEEDGVPQARLKIR